MYERNAIVLERYFNRIFNFNDESNLRQNYFNYCKLFECYKNLCDAKEKEEFSKNEFEVASKEIAKLQKNQEKLYNKGAKFEYSRYVIFNNISETPEDIEKHLNKVVDDVQKNSDELKELGQKFVEAVINYNEKSAILKDAIEKREKAQEEYDKIYLKTEKCYDNISTELISNAKEFISSDNKENRKELQDIFEDNGKKEKNQFDSDVILNTINKSIEIYKIELDIYLTGYDRATKLFEEIVSESVKIDKHTKYYKDSKAKLKFLDAEKEYIVQFLDNERIGAIYDKKSHRKLMLEACKKFALDFEQIDNLYEIINKEIAGRSTKKIYKENYNKLYLVELENSSVEPSLDTGKMRQEAIAFVNLNYWRIEGMRSVYGAFEEIVTTIYDKDLTEFIPEELKEPEAIEEIEEQPMLEVIENIAQNNKKKLKKHKVYHSSKIQLANAIYYSLQTQEFANENEVEENVEEVEVESEEQYSIPEKAQQILANIEKEEQNEISEASTKEIDDFSKEDIFDEIDDIDDNQAEDIEELEEINEVETEEDNKKVQDDIDDLEDVEIEDIDMFDDDFEEDDENLFDLSKLDDIEYEEDKETNDNKEYEDIEEDEDSILEIHFNDENKKDSIKSKVETLNKKVGLFKKIAGFNAKKRKEA